MRQVTSFITVLLGLTTALDLNAGSKLVGYYGQWSSIPVTDIQGDKLTHLNYAFANIDANSKLVVPGNAQLDIQKVFGNGDECDCCAHGNYNQLFQLRKKFPHLQVLLSIGGWTWSTHFPAAAATPISRAAFVASAMKIVRAYGFDGLDVDWEFPKNRQEAMNYLELLKLFRRELDSDAQGRLLTIASTADVSHLKDYPLREMGRVLDWINIMLYDMSVGFDHARHHAPLNPNPADPNQWPRDNFNINFIVSFFLSQVQPQKLVFGVPFYGHKYTVGPNAPNNGLFAKRVAGTPDDWLSYADIMRAVQGGGYTRHWDEVSKVPYAYNAGSGEWITYEDRESLAIKIQYAQANRLAGIMFWEYAQDISPNTEGSLAKFLRENYPGTDFSFRAPVCSKSSSFCNIQCPAGGAAGGATGGVPAGFAAGAGSWFGKRDAEADWEVDSVDPTAEDMGYDSDLFQVVYLEDQTAKMMP